MDIIKKDTRPERLHMSILKITCSRRLSAVPSNRDEALVTFAGYREDDFADAGRRGCIFQIV
jgi:hypothetical protein